MANYAAYVQRGTRAAQPAAAAVAVGTLYGVTDENNALERSTGAAWQAYGGSSRIVQVVNTQTGAVATGTTTVPFDDTIPQNTEGTEFMTLAITPTSATNKLRIDVVCNMASATANRSIAVALFQDTTADALAAVSFYSVDVNVRGAVVFTHYMTAGTTSSTTFKVRSGPSSAATVTFNGAGGGRIFGGVMASSITITEIAV